MRKILIVSHAMEIGGVERALLGLLDAIDTSVYEVDLFLLRHSGELMRYIPDKISLLPEVRRYASLAVPIGAVIKQGQLDIALGRAIGKYQAKIAVKRMKLPKDNGVAIEYSHKYTVNMMPDIQPDTIYDLAISFLTPHYFVAQKVQAKKKIAWIHTDYSVVKVDRESELKMWSAYHNIVSISDNVTDSFLKAFPSLKEKIVLIENIVPIKYMEKLTNEFTVEDEMPLDGAVKLLTIGRFSYPKRMDEIPEICARIRERGINVKWYLIGYGGDEALIRRKIAELHMEKFVVILGKKENPYPYIKTCDFYVQPSRYEGKSVAVREAQILNKPVIITDYSTAHSQVINDYDGVIVPMDIQGCADGIVAVIQDKELRQKLIMNTKKNDYANAQEIQKVYRLLEE